MWLSFRWEYIAQPIIQAGLRKSAQPLNSDVGQLLSQWSGVIMVTVDVSYVPVQYTQVVAQTESAQQTLPEVIILTQATSSEKMLQGCRDVETIVKDSAINEFNPSYIVFEHIGYQVKNGDYTAPQSVKDSVKTSLLKRPAHGTLVPQSFNFWTYQGEDNYEGKDQATFLVEVSGKRYKVVVNYLVHEIVDPNAVIPACESVFPPSTAPRPPNPAFNPDSAKARSRLTLR